MVSIKEKLHSVQQDQLLRFYDELSSEEREKFERDLEAVDWSALKAIYSNHVKPQIESGLNSEQASKIDDNLIVPLPSSSVEGTAKCDQSTLDKYRTIGMREISKGKVAALLLAGGQGTRLGVDYPKGMYDIGLASHKTLFQLQAERLQKVAQSSGRGANIPWYIMTSEATLNTTRDFFEKNQYFGLNRDEVVFFEQGTMPCMDFSGKVLLDSKNKISRSPNGNGGLYQALHEKGVLADMTSRGIEFVHAYCVDNVLVRVCDPTFIGYSIDKNADAAAKVVEKIIPEETVGTICKVQGLVKVIEYSEISHSLAHQRDDTGKLAFRAGNICEHFFKVDFLLKMKGDELPYHVAIKKIPFVSLEGGDSIKPEKPNGIKLEKFIFDVFEFAENFVAWEVKREDEFSPLKNAVGTSKDNPDTALKALNRAYELGLLTV